MFEAFTQHAAPRAALTFTSGPRAGEVSDELGGMALYHAALSPEA